jgi:hypothetical protein
MPVINAVCWEDDGHWLGYLQDYPAYWTQGDTRQDLNAHLLDLLLELNWGSNRMQTGVGVYEFQYLPEANSELTKTQPDKS